ncbi:putative pentatricopeptide repeat-containing protein At3g49142 isoform X2 [Dendrobium catenatum]|uniref:putative pentatricopeptide repeat-containing protein At3g49142 isoform X2 n=1 Tax=Dendrobium catenatum TaxID=906689 RepID=UPI00109FDCA4|nr:putative pentatricopeptide repeat-containing protein At3g49142 isoform X2 [Dendrobium catenatum]
MTKFKIFTLHKSPSRDFQFSYCSSATSPLALKSLRQRPEEPQQSSIALPQTHNTESLCFDPRSFVSSLVQCQSHFQIKKVHALAITTAMIENLGVINKLIYIYAQHKAMADAYFLFFRMKERDNVSWSVIIGGFSKVGDNYNCLKTFKEFLLSGLPMDNYTLPFALRACRDTLSPNTDARKVFDKMPKRDLVTWTVMISCYAECGSPEESMALFDRMKDNGIVPDKVSMVTVVFACAKLGAMHKAKMIRDYIWRRKFSLDVILGTAMIDMYAKCGSVDAAREIFDQMKEKNVISWSSMISAYGVHGRGREALQLFPQMLQSGIRPNRITFVSILSACSHSGLIEEGRQFFNSMERDYFVESDVKHYTCMVDLLGRAGRLDEVLELTERMKVDKDEGFWGAILGACRIHGHIGLAEKAAKNLLELGPRNSGYYVLLSNIYANAGKWEEVAKVRQMMTGRGVKKTPGWTWIEINNKLYQFIVGDKSHPQFKEIYEMLKLLVERLELAGYVPDTNFVLHDIDEELKAEFLYTHSEKLAIAFALIATAEDSAIRMTKNLRICGDCHTFIKMVSNIVQRNIVVRDSIRFHHFSNGSCSCGDYW